MPSFTIQNQDFLIKGLLASSQVALCAAAEDVLKKQGLPVPTPIGLEAKIDTGADRSVLSKGIAAQLGLHPVGVSFVDTPSSQNIRCYEYAVRIIFPNDVVWQGALLESPMEDATKQCLIGRDILGHGVLTYIGYHNLFTLSF